MAIRSSRRCARSCRSERSKCPLYSPDRLRRSWRGLLAGLQPLDREVLLQVVQGNAPLGQDTLRALRNITSLKPTIARVRKALDNLKRAGILAKPGGSYIVE